MNVYFKESLIIFRNRFARSVQQRISLTAFASLLFSSFIFTTPTQARFFSVEIPSLNTFIETIKDGDAEALRGVYVSNVMALPIIQQPEGDTNFVSSLPEVVTQFRAASAIGNIGLLAHNTRAGRLFSHIKQGDTITLIYGDGHLESFLVEVILRYEALEPFNTSSIFRDLQTGATLNATQLFNTAYGGEYHLTLQTCIQKDNMFSWGRLFILAMPIQL